MIEWTEGLPPVPSDLVLEWLKAEARVRGAAVDTERLACLGLVAELRNARKRPDLQIRCVQRCGLLHAWQMNGFVLTWHPKVRLSPARQDLPLPSGSGSELLRGWRATEAATHVLRDRAYRLDGRSNPVLLACEHRWQQVPAAELLQLVSGPRHAQNYTVDGHTWS